MLSKSTQIIKNVILLIALLCILAFSTACSTHIADDLPENDAAIPEEQSSEDTLVSSVFNSSGAKTKYTLGEMFDESGLSLTLQYSNGKTETVTSGFSSDLDTTSPGEKDVHIRYQGEDVGLLHVVVIRDAILDSCDAGTSYDDFVRLISYGGKLYGIGSESLDGIHAEFFIYRKDSLSADPVRLYQISDVIFDFLILSDRIFFSTFTYDYNLIIASIDLDGGDYYEVTDPEQDCQFCYYSNGWIYSYSFASNGIVRFRTNGSEFSSVCQYPRESYISNQRIICHDTLDTAETILCYDTTTNTSTVLVQTERDGIYLEGVYGDLLFYSVLNQSPNEDRDWDFILHNLKTGDTTVLASGPHYFTYHALVQNSSIIVYTWGGVVSFRDPAAPNIILKGFTLPVEMNGCEASGCRMVCADDLLALCNAFGTVNIDYLVDESNVVQAVLRGDGSNDFELESHITSDTSWTQVYSQFLSAYAASLSYIGSTDQYTLYDITGDGVPELFLMQRLEHGSPFCNFHIYTVDGASTVSLGQVPGSDFSLCPADDSGFLTVMRHMFCETVILYTYENGSLHEQTLLYEVPVDRLPRNASTPLDEIGYHSFTQFQTYSVDDLSGLSEFTTSSGANQALVSLLQSETKES